MHSFGFLSPGISRRLSWIAITIQIALFVLLLQYSQGRQHGMPSLSVSTKKRQTHRILTYITTHLSSQHHDFIKDCWPSLLKKLALFQRSDFMILITAENRPSMSEMNLIHSVFAKPDVAIQMRPNPGYQEGAILALVEAYRNRWFEDYDWVVRVNPDVVIRDDTFLLQTMEDDSVSGIFDDCLEKACPAGRKCVDRLIHTDFFAIRPSAISRDEVLRLASTNAENMATQAFSGIVRNGSDAWLPNTGPHHGECRVMGKLSPVVHDHNASIISCMAYP